MLLQKEKIIFEDKEVPCFLYGAVSSSLDIAHELYQKELFPEWGSVLVRSQNSGRGQMGHAWHSEEGNIYAALRLPSVGIFDTHAAAPIIGGMLVSALKEIFLAENLLDDYTHEKKFQKDIFFLKWTNDIMIFIDEKYYKIGGILLEEKENMLVAGIGINVHSSPKNIEHESNASLPASHLGKFFPITDELNFSIWSRLVYSVYLCYKGIVQSTKETRIDSKNRAVDSVFLLQKQALRLASESMAFVGKRIDIIDALPEETTDFDDTHEPIRTYTGILQKMSDEQTTLGGLVVDTMYGRRTFLSGRIRLPF